MAMLIGVSALLFVVLDFMERDRKSPAGWLLSLSKAHLVGMAVGLVVALLLDGLEGRRDKDVADRQ